MVIALLSPSSHLEALHVRREKIISGINILEDTVMSGIVSDYCAQAATMLTALNSSVERIDREIEQINRQLSIKSSTSTVTDEARCPAHD